MIVSSSTQIRVIRAFLGMDCKSFAARLGISTASLTNWERSRTTPAPQKSEMLAELCAQNGIGLLPSGMPVPFAEFFTFKPGQFSGWDSSFSPTDECVRAPEDDESMASSGVCKESRDSGNENPPSPQWPCGTAEKGKRLGRPPGSKNRNRRDELLRRLKVDVKFLESQPQISPLLKQSGILPSVSSKCSVETRTGSLKPWLRSGTL
jgi:transcriptional regulator with XRE-family HTH domain